MLDEPGVGVVLGLSGSGPGKARPVTRERAVQLGRMCSRSNADVCGHVFPGPGPGLLRRRATAGRTPSRRCRRAPGSGVGAAAGRAGAEDVTRHDRRAGDQGQVGGTVVEAAAARRRRGCPRGRCRPLPRRAAPAGSADRAAGRRRSGRAGSARPRAGTARRARRTSPAWSARGPAAARTTASSGPSMIPMWLAARITPPAAGHAVARRARATRTAERRTQPRGRRAQRVQQPAGRVPSLRPAAGSAGPRRVTCRRASRPARRPGR